MENFAVRLTSIQWKTAAKLIAAMSKYSFASITYENYAHVYNIKSIFKKIITSMFKTLRVHKTIKIMFTPNEIMSLRHLCTDNRDILDNLRYEDVIFTDISAQVNKQEVKYFSVHHYAINLTL
jgi:hypothetical protein